MSPTGCAEPRAPAFLRFSYDQPSNHPPRAGIEALYARRKFEVPDANRLLSWRVVFPGEQPQQQRRQCERRSFGCFYSVTWIPDGSCEGHRGTAQKTNLRDSRESCSILVQLVVSKRPLKRAPTESRSRMCYGMEQEFADAVSVWYASDASSRFGSFCSLDVCQKASRGISKEWSGSARRGGLTHLPRAAPL